MRLQTPWTGAVLALFVLSGAAFADVTVSQSNNPTELIGEQFASLLGAEHDVIGAISNIQLTALAVGPEASLNGKPAVKAPVLIEYTDTWLYAQNPPQGGAQWDCLKKALYFESRGESLKGQFAVAEVILNRVDSPYFPDSVCAVVGQGGNGGCQFSYACDGYSDVMHEPGAADRAGRIAAVMLAGAPRGLTTGATYFHTRAVNPSWSRRFAQTAVIGAHMFYRQ